MRNIWATRLLTFFLWFLAAASVSYWLLQTTARSKPSPALARADLAGAVPANISPNFGRSGRSAFTHSVNH